MPSDYKTLEVWKLAHTVTLEIKKDLLKDMPEEEKFSLKQQIWRATYSIPLNLAEGTGRSTNKDYAKFVYHSLGSAKELEYCIFLAKDLNYITVEKFEKYREKIVQIQRMLNGLIKSLKIKPSNFTLQTSN